jgi:outer membrane protein
MSQINRNIIYLFSATAMIFAGCSTIDNARKAQEVLEKKGTISVSFEKTVPKILEKSSLESMVAFSISNRPSMTAKRLAMFDERLKMRELSAGAPLLSTNAWWNAAEIKVGGSYSAKSASSSFSDLSVNTHGSASSAISLELLIWDFGRNDASLKSQSERVVASEFEYVKEGYNVFSETSKAYFKYLECLALLEVAFTNEHEYTVHLQRAQQKMDLGEGRKLDVLRAKLDLANAKESTVSASNEVVVSEAKLLKALGVEAFSGSASIILPRTDNLLFKMMRAFNDTEFDGQEAYKTALTNSPSIQISRAKFRAANSDVDRSVADLYPTLTASVSLNWADPLWYWNWGVNAVQSLFTGFRKTTAVDRAVVALKSAASQVDEADQTLFMNLSTAIAERDTAKQALSTAETSVREAAENLDTVRRQYDLGDVSSVEYTKAVSDYVDALGNVVRAFYRGQSAEVDLITVMGVFPIFDEGPYEAK